MSMEFLFLSIPNVSFLHLSKEAVARSSLTDLNERPEWVGASEDAEVDRWAQDEQKMNIKNIFKDIT